MSNSLHSALEAWDRLSSSYGTSGFYFFGQRSVYEWAIQHNVAPLGKWSWAVWQNHPGETQAQRLAVMQKVLDLTTEKIAENPAYEQVWWKKMNQTIPAMVSHMVRIQRSSFSNAVQLVKVFPHANSSVQPSFQQLNALQEYLDWWNVVPQHSPNGEWELGYEIGRCLYNGLQWWIVGQQGLQENTSDSPLSLIHENLPPPFPVLQAWSSDAWTAWLSTTLPPRPSVHWDIAWTFWLDVARTRYPALEQAFTSSAIQGKKRFRSHSEALWGPSHSGKVLPWLEQFFHQHTLCSAIEHRMGCSLEKPRMDNVGQALVHRVAQKIQAGNLTEAANLWWEKAPCVAPHQMEAWSALTEKIGLAPSSQWCPSPALKKRLQKSLSSGHPLVQQMLLWNVSSRGKRGEFLDEPSKIVAAKRRL